MRFQAGSGAGRSLPGPPTQLSTFPLDQSVHLDCVQQSPLNVSRAPNRLALTRRLHLSQTGIRESDSVVARSSRYMRRVCDERMSRPGFGYLVSEFCLSSLRFGERHSVSCSSVGNSRRNRTILRLIVVTIVRLFAHEAFAGCARHLIPTNRTDRQEKSFSFSEQTVTRNRAVEVFSKRCDSDEAANGRSTSRGTSLLLVIQINPATDFRRPGSLRLVEPPFGLMPFERISRLDRPPRAV